MSYSVILHHPHCTPPLQLEAERRYRVALEHALGGVDHVVAAWRIWQDVENARSGALSEADYRVARRWILAAERARTKGLHPELDHDDAYFEVQVER